MADSKFRKSCLDQHNALRKKHGVPALTLNDAINKTAQKWADHIAKNNLFSHSKPDQRMYKGDQMGENIAMRYSSDGRDFTGEQATNDWYSEIERYNFSTNSGPQTGHFTQVVWKGSKEMGVGKAQTKDGKWLVVANYSPAGNFIGQYGPNVPPPVNGKVEIPEGAGNSGGGGGGAGLGAAAGGGTTKVSTSTKTMTQTVNGKTVVKKIITKTTTHPDGRQMVETTETEETK